MKYDIYLFEDCKVLKTSSELKMKPNLTKQSLNSQVSA